MNKDKIIMYSPEGQLQDSVQASGVLDISNLSRKEIKKLAKNAAGWSGENGTFSWQDIVSGQADVQGKFTRHEDLFKRKFDKQLKKNLHHTEQQKLLQAAKDGDTKAMEKYVASKRDDAAPIIGAVTLLPATLMAGIGTGAFAAGVEGIKALYTQPLLRLGFDTAGTVDGIKNMFSGNGVQKTIKLAREGDTWGAIKSGSGDVLDFLGISDLVRIGSRFNKANRALHALDVIEPTDYRRPFKRGLQWTKDIISDKPVDLDNLQWRQRPQYAIDKLGEQFLLRDDPRIYAAKIDATDAEKALANEIGLNAREDALRMYLGFPQKYDTYIPNGDGTFSYNIEKLKESGFNFEGFGQGYDYLTTNAGNWKSNGIRDIMTDDLTTHSVHSVEDIWDLNPFQHAKIPIFRKIEAGNIIGGKPFTLKMDIPFTSFTDRPPILGHQKLSD